MEDLSDIYIKGTNDPEYQSNKLENVTFIDVVVAKLYMLLMTNKGEVLGDYNFGCDIPKYLWKTNFPSDTIKSEIIEQISTYIPELNKQDYLVNVYLVAGNYQDIGVINISLGIADVNVIFK